MKKNLDDFDFYAFEQWLKHWSGQRVNLSWFTQKTHKKWCGPECIHSEIIKIAITASLIEQYAEHETIKDKYGIKTDLVRPWIIVN